MAFVTKLTIFLLSIISETLFTAEAFCFPGQEAVLNATSGRTVCVDCPTGKYSKRGKKCFLCSICHQGQHLVRKCTSNHNTVCHCSPGTFLKDSAICKRCSVCLPGTFQILECSHNMDRSCRKCPDGLTTNRTNVKRCVAKTIESQKNVVTHKIFDWWTFLIIPVVLLLVGCGGGIYYWWVCRKKHNKNKPIATAEFYDDDSCPERVLFVPDEIETFSTENLRKVRDLPAHLYDEIGLKLNNHHRRNWKYLAGMLGLSREDILYLELEPREATQNLLHDWSTRDDATVYNLHSVLVNMGRSDAANVVEQYIYR